MVTTGLINKTQSPTSHPPSSSNHQHLTKQTFSSSCRVCCNPVATLPLPHTRTPPQPPHPRVEYAATQSHPLSLIPTSTLNPQNSSSLTNKTPTILHLFLMQLFFPRCKFAAVYITIEKIV